jgi:hypothetical protein
MSSANIEKLAIRKNNIKYGDLDLKLVKIG